MQPIGSVKKVLTLLYLCAPDENSSKIKKIFCMACSFGVLTVMTLGASAGAFFAIEYVSIDAEKCLFATFHTVAYYTLIYMLIVIILWRNEMLEVFNSISKIYQLASKTLHGLDVIYFLFAIVLILFLTFGYFSMQIVFSSPAESAKY